jgi:hypothetical protein
VHFKLICLLLPEIGPVKWQSKGQMQVTAADKRPVRVGAFFLIEGKFDRIEHPYTIKGWISVQGFSTYMTSTSFH